MASQKKTRAFQDYAEALARTEELAASGDQESDDFLAAAEAAASLFLLENDVANPPNRAEPYKNVSQRHGLRKWLTIKDLLKKHDKKHGT